MPRAFCAALSCRSPTLSEGLSSRSSVCAPPQVPDTAALRPAARASGTFAGTKITSPARPYHEEEKSLPRKHIPQLDGMRGLAVVLVLLAHSATVFTRVPVFNWVDGYGNLGVQLFFVLSGFLITRILLDTKETPNFFRNFFVRRALRIYPLYYAVLLFVVFSGVVHQHGVRWWPYILYLSNIVYGNSTQPAPLGPVWSLAVEEQFYLVWPFVVAVLSRRGLERLCVTMLIGAIGLRLTGVLQFHNTLLQLDALAAGALIACRFDQIAAWRPYAWFAACLLPLGLSLPIGFWNNISQTIQVLAGAALLIVLMDNEVAISRVFRAPALRYLGKISYGVYLLHSLVFAVFFRSRFGISVIESGSAFAAVLCLLAEFAIALAIATLSFYFFESPLLRLKRYFEPEKSGAKKENRMDLPSLVEV
jgi:peptidoglycan/LPS O-acetylase OafA/YrhL